MRESGKQRDLENECRNWQGNSAFVFSTADLFIRFQTGKSSGIILGCQACKMWPLPLRGVHYASLLCSQSSLVPWALVWNESWEREMLQRCTCSLGKCFSYTVGGNSHRWICVVSTLSSEGVNFRMLAGHNQWLQFRKLNNPMMVKSYPMMVKSSDW